MRMHVRGVAVFFFAFNVCPTHEVPGEEIHARICGMNERKGRNYDVPMTSAHLQTPERCNLLSLNYLQASLLHPTCYFDLVL